MDDVFKAGRTAVITGGASGIGFAVAKKCADIGMNIVIADINEEALQEKAAALRSLGAPEVLAFHCDVGKADCVQSLADAVFGDPKFGDCAFLHLNAGLASGFSAHATSLTKWKLCLDVNLYGVIHGLHSFTQRMIEQEKPSKIAATSSLSGLVNTGTATGIPYVVAKHGVTLLMESLQHELRESKASQHVSAHLLHPGIVRTNIGENSTKAVQSLGDDSSDTFPDTGDKVGALENARMTAEEAEAVTYSSEQCADGFFEAMSLGKFYCVVSPSVQPESLFKALVGMRAHDIMYNSPPLSQHVPSMRKESRERLKKLREEAKPFSKL